MRGWRSPSPIAAMCWRPAGLLSPASPMNSGATTTCARPILAADQLRLGSGPLGAQAKLRLKAAGDDRLRSRQIKAVRQRNQNNVLPLNGMARDMALAMRV